MNSENNRYENNVNIEKFQNFIDKFKKIHSNYDYF